MKITKHSDVIKHLGKVVELNTAAYKSDFEYDKAILNKAATQTNEGDIWYFWLSRPCGTECFLLDDVFTSGTYANIAWLYHAESGERCFAYAIEITGLDDGRISGNLFELNLKEHAAMLRNVIADKSAGSCTEQDKETLYQKLSEQYKQGLKEHLKHRIMSGKGLLEHDD